MKKLTLLTILILSVLALAETDSTVIKLDQKIQALKQQQEQIKADFNRIEGAIIALEAVKKEMADKPKSVKETKSPEQKNK